ISSARTKKRSWPQCAPSASRCWPVGYLALWGPSSTPSPRGPRAAPLSEGTQECDQISLLLICKPDIESLVIEVDDIEQGGRRAVVKVWSTRRQSSQDRSLDLADVGTLAGNQRSARVRHLEYFSGRR